MIIDDSWLTYCIDLEALYQKIKTGCKNYKELRIQLKGAARACMNNSDTIGAAIVSELMKMYEKEIDETPIRSISSLDKSNKVKYGEV